MTLFDCNHLAHVIVLWQMQKEMQKIFLLCVILNLRAICKYKPPGAFTVPFKSKLTVRCESRFSTRFPIFDSCANLVEDLVSQTKNKRLTDFSIILQRHTAVTQRRIVIFAQTTDARNKTNSSYKANVSSRTSVSSFISSNKVSSACSIPKCIQTVHTRVQGRAFCNAKRFWAYSAAWLDKDQL